MDSAHFRTETCTLSTPCSKCRSASINAAHTPVRFDAGGRRRGRHHAGGVTRYETRGGGYWQRAAA
ncbi:MAG: hypothetical protein GEU75_13520 [Dehalococcoidia bacterium]|nr:hypothetical protein [Dehalococcoidia bacterium]